jgi:hypothetical protein
MSIVYVATRWGADEGKSPNSPGNQTRFKCPWREMGEKDPTACPSRVARDAVEARRAAASACGSWFGAMVVVTACSPAGLRHGVHTASMGRRGSLRILRGSQSRHAASLPGVAQAMGQPLKVGEGVTIAGHARGDTKLYVRGASGRHVVEAVFVGLGLSHGGQGTIAALAGRDGPQLVWTSPDGRPVQPIAVHVATLPQPVRWAVGHNSPKAAGHPGDPKTASARTHACKRPTARDIRSLIRKRRLSKSATSRVSELEGRHASKC